MNKKHITFLDEDQVLRLVWLALCDTATNATQEIKDWFLPELVDPVSVTKLADGLHPRDGYEVHYGRDTSQSLKDASVVILRRSSVSSDLIASAPNLRLIQAAWGAAGKHRPCRRQSRRRGGFVPAAPDIGLHG